MVPLRAKHEMASFSGMERKGDSAAISKYGLPLVESPLILRNIVSSIPNDWNARSLAMLTDWIDAAQLQIFEVLKIGRWRV